MYNHGWPSQFLKPCILDSSFFASVILPSGIVTELNSGFDVSLAGLEKVYVIVVNGTDEEKVSAATVLCGAFLTRGWNI